MQRKSLMPLWWLINFVVGAGATVFVPAVMTSYLPVPEKFMVLGFTIIIGAGIAMLDLRLYLLVQEELRRER